MEMNQQIDSTIVPQRLFATLSAGFGALGALLAVIELYGLLAYTVVWRTHEIGVRMALGAAGTDVMRLVLRDALWMVCAGLAVGAPLAFWGKRAAASLIPGLPVASPLPIVLAAAIMIAVGLIAAYLPARRAMRVDPNRRAEVRIDRPCTPFRPKWTVSDKQLQSRPSRLFLTVSPCCRYSAATPHFVHRSFFAQWRKDSHL
jgi:predicted lysophospholipase L1 biosynthesis ABC-type transport system permease subunit